MSVFIDEANLEQAEIVYSPEMDQESRKRGRDTQEHPQIKELGDIKTSVSVINSELIWHRRVGWGIAGLIGSGVTGAFLWLLTSYLPNQLSQNAQATTSAFKEQLGAVNTQLAVLTATVELLKPAAAKSLPHLMQQQLKKGANPDFGLRVVAAIAEQARDDRLSVTDPATMAEVGTAINDVRKTVPGSSSAASVALTNVANYRSYANAATNLRFLNIPLESAKSPISIELGLGPGPGAAVGIGQIGRGIPITEAALSERITHPSTEKTGPEYYIIAVIGRPVILDGLHIRNVVFRDTIIEYQGGPVKLENVTFINCTFRVRENEGGFNFQVAAISESPLTFKS